MLCMECLGAQRSPLCLHWSVQIWGWSAWTWGWSAIDVEDQQCLSPLHWLLIPSTLTVDPCPLPLQDQQCWLSLCWLLISYMLTVTEISIVFMSICADLGLIHMDPGLICSWCREDQQCLSPLHWLLIPSTLTVDPHPPTPYPSPAGSSVDCICWLLIPSMLTVNSPPPRIHADPGLIWVDRWSSVSCWLTPLQISTF